MAAANHQARHIIGRLLVIINYRRDGVVRWKAISIDKRYGFDIGQINDLTTVISNINDAFHLLGRHGTNDFVQQLFMFFSFGKIVVIFFEQAHIPNNYIKSVGFTVGINSVYNIRCIEYGKIFCNDSNRFGTLLFQIFFQSVRHIMKFGGQLFNLFRFYFSSSAFSVYIRKLSLR